MMSTRLMQFNLCRLPRLYAFTNKPVITCANGRKVARNYATNLTKETRIFGHNNKKAAWCIHSATATINQRYFSNAAINNNSSNNDNTNKKRLPKAETFDGLLTRVQMHYENNSYLNYGQCQRLVEMLIVNNEDNTHKLTTEQAHFLLIACVPELLPTQNTKDRLALFTNLWQYLTDNDQLNVKHHLIKLQMLRQNRMPLRDFHGLLDDLKRYEPIEDSTYAEIYSALLDVACACGNIRQATELISEMRSRNYALNEHNFNALILGHARSRNLDGVQSVLDSMSAAGVQLSMETYSILILGYLENGEMEKAMDLLQRFHNQFKGHQLIRMMRASLHTTIPLEILEQLVHELPKDYVAGSDIPAGLRSLCVELLYKGKLPLVETIISALPTPEFNENQDIDSFGVFLLREMFHTPASVAQIINMAQLLHASGKNTRALHLATEIALRRQPGNAINFLEELNRTTGEELRPHYFWPLLVYNVRRNGESGVFQSLKEMQRLKVACDEETIKLYILPNLWVTLENPQLALKQLNDHGVRISQVLEPIIVHLMKQNKDKEISELCELYPTRIDLINLVQQLSTLAVTTRATKSYHRFVRLVAALSKKSSDNKIDFVGSLLLQMLAPQTRLRTNSPALQRFLSEMEKQSLTISNTASEAIISIISPMEKEANEEYSRICRILQKMRNSNLTLPQENLSVTGQSSSSTVSGVGSASSSASSSFIKHPREMNLGELECHLIELESKQLNARGILRRLLQLYVRDGKVEKALEIKHKCDRLKVQTSPGMLASIFDMYIKLKDLNMAQQSLQQLEQKYPGFQIDEHKLIDYAALLVEGHQLEAAKNLLKERAARSKVNGGDYVIKNVWNLLTNVAQYAAAQAQEHSMPDQDTNELPYNLTHETFLFLRQLRFCNSNNAVLGPIVREWLLRGDIKSAIAEFKRLAEKYKHTPLQFELLSLLVRLSNGDETELKRFAPIDTAQAQQLLTQATETVTKVHGPPNMNSALLLAFAESGTDNQLRRLVINPEFCVNHDLLLKNCEHLGQEGAIRSLLKLARGVRGLQRVINEQQIYDMLLTKFIEANDYEAALDLYERLEEDDELKVSQQFLRNLISLLKVNNIEIPSNIALRGQVM